MKNKTILITGGTTGIGLATAQLLAADGAKVIVTGRNPDTLAAAQRALPAGTVVLKSDAGSLADAQALGAEVKKHAATIDGAFLNAGVASFAPLEAATPEQYAHMFDINVRGLFFQLQSLLPVLANPSAVILTASIAGSGSMAGASLYSATKAAVMSFGRTLAVELAPRGIRLNTISPGPIETPIFGKTGLPEEAMKGFEQQIVSQSLLKRMGTADEVAKLARFLLSEDSSNIVGAEFIIDGGVRLS
ncbi:MAG TPA: SDR family oxidoreductase [Chthoniobacteraceae bacterium]|nr:SDR family oxidoreductase [Chthoniobacteraceae bacterium]